MARMLAQHCELRSATAERIELVVPAAHRHLMDKPYQDRVRTAIGQHLGSALKVDFVLAEGSGNTPAEIEGRAMQQKQMRAIETIERDPFVRELVDEFGAQVNQDSIKPLQ